MILIMLRYKTETYMYNEKYMHFIQIRHGHGDPASMNEIRNRLAELFAFTQSGNPENYLPFLANFERVCKSFEIIKIRLL